MAPSLQLSPSSEPNWRAGRNESVPLETLEKICTVLNCTLDDIVEFSEDEKEGMNDILKIGKITVRVIDNILQLTDAPDIVTSGDGDKYIGYEYIGEAYSGNRKYAVDEGDALFADYISEKTGNGVFLDLGCGDGCITVPCAK
ncbi:MAG: helix-turn-helix domain-containing protein, partial [Clostridia bacterium]|nr:helix-turn-helix domain-containing protein [Clostridia bacterium]